MGLKIIVALISTVFNNHNTVKNTLIIMLIAFYIAFG